MGTVYLARSRGGRAVAVKVARPELASDPSFRARFRAEVAAARRVGGFHTAQVVDADPDAEAPWLATAYVPGPTLAGLVTAEGPMDEPRLRALGAALAEALEAIHACGLVHRDLKPGNIVMAPDGPRVLDFGIARALESTRLTATGSAFGTPGYLAPEQALGEEVTGAADVFALGAVLVAAAGGRPFGEGTPMGLMYRSVHEAPDLASVPEALRGLVARCLAKDPAGRPTPDEILDALGEGGPHPATVVVPAAPAHGPPPGQAPPPGHAPPHVPPQGFGPPRGFGAPGAFAVPPPPSVPPGAVPLGFVPPGSVRPGFVPEFVAADRVSGIVVDGSGVHLQLYGDEVDFGWEEISGVDLLRTRRGRGLRVVVSLHGGGAYTCELDGRRAARVEEWVARLDPVLATFLPRR
ncbi:serine/threonine protein kinase [Streptomyces sp. NRRL F-6491]|nr:MULTISPECIES: serine/threonine-protein kinase [unclassified Streptomyces]KOX19779.1 serine/threonine protein kinase [Streptomyces sp. NRRL F-6491]KOX37902.1 serine/threonine protein kinase [Streptomyces sp. NRRL F-6492]